ncbi:MAG: hybrid sensor histidine kinase/response regulator [Chitinophagia bacterium]|nr:hybrid sensor histidine kinase/response regulator [Chitinophagia bacterium]
MLTNHNRARILIVDDDNDDYLITGDYIRSIPGNAYIIDWCPNYAEGLKKLLNNEYDLYFVDYRLGAKSGVDFLMEAKASNCPSPIVLLTGKGNYNVDLQAMELGAVDYLVKTELTIEKMERCIRYSLERAATMQALRTNEKKYRTIFEKSKDVVFVTDSALRFKDINSAVYHLLGYQPEELQNRNLCDFVDQAQHKKYIQQTLQHGLELDDWEVVLNTRDGEKKYCTLSITVDDTDAPEGNFQGIIHDISSLKKIEKANLQGEKLAAAGRLVRAIAHEVRNPLNNITLAVEQMQHELKDERLDLYLNIIQRNGRRISDLISELLYTSRPAENTLEQQPLQGVLDDVISICLDRLTLKRIRLQVQYPDEVVLIMADREKLKLALLNIVINAIEAMEENTGILAIKLNTHNKNAELVIADNGSGISEENISRLFEPYFTQKRNGVGLGLTFTLNILQAHKANIEVSSELSKGTAFTITFPLS